MDHDGRVRESSDRNGLLLLLVTRGAILAGAAAIPASENLRLSSNLGGNLLRLLR
jgi:hypothetical protein